MVAIAKNVNGQNSAPENLLGICDIPVEDNDGDFLKMSKYSHALAKFAIECSTPMTVALQGDWGSGKTSLMNLIKEKLDEDKGKYMTIWFNTWQYSQFGMNQQLVVSLIKNFISKFPEDDESKLINAGLTVLAAALDTARITGSFFGGGIARATYAATGIIEDNIKRRGTFFDLFDLFRRSDNSSDKKEISGEFLEKLRNYLKKIVKEQNKKIIVFIDDLDRLQPVKAVELLEVFKLFLDIKNCVFFLACDYKIIEQGLRTKFGDASVRDEQSFFDKIIQLPFNMPMPTNTGQYVEKLFMSTGIVYDKGDIDTYVNIIERSVGLNPRSMKRIFNLLLLNVMVGESEGLFQNQDISKTEEKIRLLFLVICMQLAFEPLFLYFYKKGSSSKNILDLFAKNKINGSRIDICEDSKGKTSAYDSMIAEITKNNASIRSDRIYNFLETMYEAMQLKHDNDSNVLTNEEYNEFISIIKQSKVTSITVSENEEEFETLNTREKRREMQDILSRVLNNLGRNAECKSFLKLVNSELPDKPQWHRNTSETDIVIINGNDDIPFGSFCITVEATSSGDRFYIFMQDWSEDDDENLIDLHNFRKQLDKYSLSADDDIRENYSIYEDIFKENVDVRSKVTKITEVSLDFMEAICKMYR